MADDGFDPAGGGFGHDGVHHGILHAALEHAAAHEPERQVEHIALLPARHNGDNAVITKFIHELAAKAEVVFVPRP